MILLAARAAAGQLLRQSGFREGLDFRIAGTGERGEPGDVPVSAVTVEEPGRVTTALSVEGFLTEVTTEAAGDIVRGSHTNLLGLPLAELTAALRDPRFNGRIVWRIADPVPLDDAPPPAGAVLEPVLLLASASPRRRQLIAGVVPADRVLIMVSEHEEHREPGETAAQRVCRLAREKAEIVRALDYPRSVRAILGADTEVVVDGESLGKPESKADAERMLGLLQGRTHQVITGLAVLTPDGRSAADSVSTDVTFRSMTAGEIESYAGCGEPMGKAGAYAIQGRGAMFISRIDGSYTNVVGLPVERVREMLGKTGFPRGSPWPSPAADGA